MSDADAGEEDLGKFLEGTSEDDIKPIDVGNKNINEPPGAESEPPATQGDPALTQEAGPVPIDQITPKSPPLSPGEQINEDGAVQKEADDILKKAEAEAAPGPELLDDHGQHRNSIVIGDYYDLKKAKPSINRIRVGAGWDPRSHEGVPPDLDLSMFLLGKDGLTRVDEDFIFYNNAVVLDGAIQHMGDSRTGAGEGDDEMIKVDLNAIPFDVMSVVFILSVYDQDGVGDHLEKVKNVFIRFVDEEDRLEIVYYQVKDEDLTTATALKILEIVREGPQWFLQPCNDAVVGGLAKAATNYGIIIQEVMSTEFSDDV